MDSSLSDDAASLPPKLQPNTTPTKKKSENESAPSGEAKPLKEVVSDAVDSVAETARTIADSASRPDDSHSFHLDRDAKRSFQVSFPSIETFAHWMLWLTIWTGAITMAAIVLSYTFLSLRWANQFGILGGLFLGILLVISLLGACVSSLSAETEDARVNSTDAQV